ncbi:MAG: hypothetical protein EBU90_18075 [Proteobacteria bacterium]|nr:hypothetical protein [Pseudomonadota bacterium]NBP15529.1 hypothetical protein [bacterium]
MKKQMLLFLVSISIFNLSSLDNLKFAANLNKATKLLINNAGDMNLMNTFKQLSLQVVDRALLEESYQEAKDFFSNSPYSYSGNKDLLNLSLNSTELVKEAETLNNQINKPVSWFDLFTLFYFSKQIEHIKELDFLLERSEQTIRNARYLVDNYRAIPIAVIARYQFNKRNADIIKQDPLLCVV